MKKTGFFKSKSAKLYYTIKGNGTQPIILIHGNGEKHQIFKKQAEILEKYYTVILLDSRGHGLSAMGREELTIELMAIDVHNLIKELNLKSAVLFGFSDGANVAIQTAIMYPEEVKGIVAVSGNVNPYGLSPVFLFVVRFMYYSYLVLEKLHFKMKEKRQLMGLMAWHPHITEQQLENINAPVLILTGTKDIIKSQHSLEMGRLIPNATVKIIENSGHFSMFERTDEYMKIIIGYLKKNDM